MKAVDLITRTLAALVMLPFALAACGSDDAAGGGDGDDDGDGDTDRGSVAAREDCLRFVAAACDYFDDCADGDEEECLGVAERECADAEVSSTEKVDQCVAALEGAECDSSFPRACEDAVTFPEDGGDGDGDGDGDACSAAGELCDEGACCEGARCILLDDEPTCATTCTAPADCASGCCVTIGDDSGACYPAELCR